MKGPCLGGKRRQVLWTKGGEPTEPSTGAVMEALPGRCHSKHVL